MARVGDRVGIDHHKYPGVWIVASVGPKNVVLEREGGGGRPMRVPQSMLIDPDTAAVRSAEPTEFYDPGELVRITAGKYAGLYVVIADKGEKVNVAKLGGDGGRYVRAMRRGLVKVDARDVLIEGALS
jgi:hypothetical protein